MIFIKNILKLHWVLIIEKIKKITLNDDKIKMELDNHKLSISLDQDYVKRYINNALLETKKSLKDFKFYKFGSNICKIAIILSAGMYFGCIKCGLNENVFHLKDIYNDLSYFTDEQQIMYDFMKNHHYHLGINTKMFCELDLARAIYSKIIEAHPNIDDETVRKYFEISLNNIRKFKVDDERKNNVAKRLSLNPKSIR